MLLGSSLHSEYSFREDRRFNEHFLVGQISLRDVELLQTGSLKQILPGPRYIHSLFHLDHPSATVVIRTERSASAPIQYDYRKPSVAIDPFFKDPQTFRRLQTIRLLLSTNYEHADAMLCDLVSASDVHTTFLALGTIFRHLRHDPLEKLFELSRTAPRLRACLESARASHGETIELFEQVFDEEERQLKLIDSRRTINDPGLRFFLALLLNLPNSSEMFRLVRQCFPGREPVETVLDWVEQLGRTRSFGSGEPNLLNVQEFDDNLVLSLEDLLKGVLPNGTMAQSPVSATPPLMNERLRVTLESSAILRSLVPNKK